ncbi:MAG: hypothetical protein AAB381_02985 [Patescibacteria group bacterium]
MNSTLSTLEKIGGWTSTLLLGKTKEIIIRTDERVQSLIKITDGLRKDLDDGLKEVRGSIHNLALDVRALQLHTKYGVANSPIVPAENGKKLLEDSGFNTKVFPIIERELFSLMDSEGLRTLYDYEKGAFLALMELKKIPAMDPLKDHAVNHPNEPLELIFEVASWVIRDRYAEYLKNKK